LTKEPSTKPMIHCLTVGLLQVNCYVVWDRDTREALVIDPGGDADKIVELLRHYDLNLKRIVNSHSHFDHVDAVRPLQEETNAPFYIHRDGRELLASAQIRAAQFGLRVDDPPEPDGFVEEGEEFRIGQTQFTVRHTPGHSPDGICLVTADAVFTGDTLFAGGIGRYDIPGSSLDDLVHSLRTVLLALPDELAVYPGHGPASSIAIERAHNPFLHLLMSGQSLPGYF